MRTRCASSASGSDSRRRRRAFAAPRKGGSRRRFPEAIAWYEQALSISPTSAGTLAALAFTHHLQGRLGVAIEIYHKALGLRPDDTFAADMLSECIMEHAAVQLTVVQGEVVSFV